MKFEEKNMKFSEMPYNRVTLEEFDEKSKKLITRMRDAKSAQEAIDTYYEYDKYGEKAGKAISLAFVRFSLNTEDEFYLAEKEYYDQVMPQFQSYDMQFKHALYNSQFADELKKE